MAMRVKAYHPFNLLWYVYLKLRGGATVVRDPETGWFRAETEEEQHESRVFLSTVIATRLSAHDRREVHAALAALRAYSREATVFALWAKLRPEDTVEWLRRFANAIPQERQSMVRSLLNDPAAQLWERTPRGVRWVAYAILLPFALLIVGTTVSIAGSLIYGLVWLWFVTFQTYGFVVATAVGLAVSALLGLFIWATWVRLGTEKVPVREERRAEAREPTATRETEPDGSGSSSGSSSSTDWGKVLKPLAWAVGIALVIIAAAAVIDYYDLPNGHATPDRSASCQFGTSHLPKGVGCDVSVSLPEEERPRCKARCAFPPANLNRPTSTTLAEVGPDGTPRAVKAVSLIGKGSHSEKSACARANEEKVARARWESKGSTYIFYLAQSC